MTLSLAAVFLFFKGRDDINSEISKASKKLSSAEKGIERQKKSLADEEKGIQT